MGRRHGAKLVWNQNGVAYPSWAGDDYSTINQEMAALSRGSRHCHLPESIFKRLR